MATTWRAGPDTGEQREVCPTLATYDRAGKRYALYASLPFVENVSFLLAMRTSLSWGVA